ncbi:MAG TPA: SusC/RagA family TonB-linked outer membrane protein [Mucilaginibacter sp.]|jgi:TonB-linked SusC/RagA family outer membrane protein|nr:SusC/RagA family TonB-linked outer membrane protein [Mucilaginibacter sp.]
MYKKQLLKLFLCPLFLLLSSWAMAQKITVTGRITDATGQALPGATITVKGSKSGTNSDANGKYSIGAAGNDILVFSLLGYLKQEIPVNNRTGIDVQLADDLQRLNEVVVVGYGTQKRSDLTGSIVSVKGSDFKDQPISNPIEGLQGRAAGVEIIENSGQPGAQPTIIIRGVSSLNQPQPLYIVDGVRVNDASEINPQDVGSINVLKDASAAAIYGSAAAGGVILITTKRSSSYSPVVNFSARYGVTNPKLVQLNDRDQFIQLENIVNPQYFKNATQTDTLANTNWVDVLYRTANEQNYNLSVTGSSPNVDYLFSGFYNPQTGIFLKNYSDLSGIRANTDYRLGKWIKVGEQMTFTQRIGAPLVGSQADIHNAPFRTQPIIPVFDKSGNYGTEPSGYNGLQFSGPNPYGAVESASVQDKQNNFQGNAYVDIKLPVHLDFRSTWGYTDYTEAEDIFQNSFNFGPVALPVNNLTKSYVETTQLDAHYVLTYDQNFGKHSINAIAGFEQITGSFNNINGNETAIGLPGYSFVQTSNSGITLNGTYDGQELIKSQFGRLNYNYAEKYFLSASIRQDANYTVFGPNKQSGVFPAASAGWTVSEEPFFKPLTNFINSFKIRGSYGSLGNSNFPPYRYTSTYGQFYGTNGGASAGGQNFSPGGPLLIANSLTGIPNPYLAWETVHETNIGIDAELLQGSLYFTAEWYNKNTVGMVYALPLPPSAGFTQPFISNIGTVNNRGVDLLAGYRNKAGKFSYDVSVTASFNKNDVTSLSGTATSTLLDGYNYYNNGDPAFNIMSNQPLTITKAGLPFGSFWGLKVLGIFKTDAEAASQTVNGQPAHAGDLIYQDLNHDGKIDASDDQVIGNPNPKLVYGANIHLSYMHFDVQMLFHGVAGVQLFNGVKAYEQYPFADGNTSPAVFNDSFLGSNGLTSQPRLGVVNPDGSFTLDPNKNYTSVNSYFVQSGAYLKLKNLQLGYTFSNDLLRQVSIKSARIFVMANNVFTITKYTGLDPELAGSFTGSGYQGITTRGVDAVSQYPQVKIYTIGADLTF